MEFQRGLRKVVLSLVALAAAGGRARASENTAEASSSSSLFTAEGLFNIWNPHPGLVAPFVLMLLAIAVIPLVKEHWWEHNVNKLKVSLVLGLPMLAYLLFGQGLYSNVILTLLEFSSFLCLLLALFTVSGGIVVKGSFRGKPLTNVIILAIGTVLASFMGTTGAAMLLIRPLLNANAHRKSVVHVVVFFIFCVANCGGLLTPLGDPPLFLGFLKGVAFDWTFNLWKEWLLVNSVVLFIFYLFDSYKMKGDNPPPPLEGAPEKIGLAGTPNLILLVLVPSTIIGSAQLHQWWHHEHLHHVEAAAAAELVLGEQGHEEKEAPLEAAKVDEYLERVKGAGLWTAQEIDKVEKAEGEKRFEEFEGILLDHTTKLLRQDNALVRHKEGVENPHSRYVDLLKTRSEERYREHAGALEWGTVKMEAVILGFQVLCFVLIALASLKISTKANRARNGFSWHPIEEVGFLFFGIFVTMIPALIVLNNSGGRFGDFTIDSPTKFFWMTGILSSFLDNAPTYLTFLATAQGALGVTVKEIQVGALNVSPAIYLAAISCGAVFMGANTYIGNAPNFMVKSIAEERKIKMPSFFGYMLYSGLILLPVFALVTYLFFWN